MPITKSRFQEVARIASPAERLASWRSKSGTPDYLSEVLPTFERLSREVQASTFHIHGTVRPKKITCSYISGYAADLRAHFITAGLPPKEETGIMRRIAIAQSDMADYAARSIIARLRHLEKPLWAEEIQELAIEATTLFRLARDRPDYSQDKQETLAKKHEQQVALTRRDALTFSLVLDIRTIHDQSVKLDACQRDNLVRRSSGNIDILKTIETAPQKHRNLEKIRSDIGFTDLFAQLPRDRQKLEKTLLV